MLENKLTLQYFKLKYFNNILILTFKVIYRLKQFFSSYNTIALTPRYLNLNLRIYSQNFF